MKLFATISICIFDRIVQSPNSILFKDYNPQPQIYCFPKIYFGASIVNENPLTAIKIVIASHIP